MYRQEIDVLNVNRCMRWSMDTSGPKESTISTQVKFYQFPNSFIFSTILLSLPSPSFSRPCWRIHGRMSPGRVIEIMSWSINSVETTESISSFWNTTIRRHIYWPPHERLHPTTYMINQNHASSAHTHTQRHQRIRCRTISKSSNQWTTILIIICLSRVNRTVAGDCVEHIFGTRNSIVFTREPYVISYISEKKWICRTSSLLSFINGPLIQTHYFLSQVFSIGRSSSATFSEIFCNYICL